MIYLAQLSMAYYINLVRPVESSGTQWQCYKISRQILQCSALQILAAAIARTYRLSQTNSLLWRNGLECARNSHFHQILTLSSSVLPSLPGSYDKSQTWVVGKTFVFFIPGIQILNCLSETQRRKNLGSRVALLPGKFLRVRKVFARITEKTI